MAGAKGYHTYRGRGSKWKVLLAVLLVLVILAAAVVMLLQRYIVYDEAGTPRLELPWQEEKEQLLAETPEGTVDLVIQEPEPPPYPEIRAFTVAETPLTLAGWNTARTQADSMAGGNCNAAVVTIKDEGGHVRFDSAAAVRWAREIENDTAAALTEMIQGETAVEYAIARMVCFRDPRGANSNAEHIGLKNTGGYLFYDGNNSPWMDPAKPDARAYLCELAKEAAALGFDELLLTDVSYPTVGQLDKIAYSEPTKSPSLSTFLKEMRAALEGYDIVLSIELPAAVITSGRDDTAGLVLAEIAPLVDRIYADAVPEEVETLAAAVTAMGEQTDFVPRLAAYDPALKGSQLIAAPPLDEL